MRMWVYASCSPRTTCCCAKASYGCSARLPISRWSVRAANLFRQTHPSVGVVVLSQYADPGYALALLEHGSEQRAYLLKDRVSDIDQLVDAIRVVSDGGS